MPFFQQKRWLLANVRGYVPVMSSITQMHLGSGRKAHFSAADRSVCCHRCQHCLSPGFPGGAFTTAYIYLQSSISFHISVSSWNWSLQDGAWWAAGHLNNHSLTKIPTTQVAEEVIALELGAQVQVGSIQEVVSVIPCTETMDRMWVSTEVCPWMTNCNFSCERSSSSFFLSYSLVGKILLLVNYSSVG